MIDPNATDRVVEVNVDFSYDMPDAYLYQTANLGKVGTWTYEGPKELWVFLRKRDNKRTGQTRFAYEIEDNYMPNAGDYMVKINCEEDPLLCELMETDQDTLFLEGREMVSETLPVNDWEGNPFVHIEPKVPTPDHTYEMKLNTIQLHKNGLHLFHLLSHTQIGKQLKKYVGLD